MAGRSPSPCRARRAARRRAAASAPCASSCGRRRAPARRERRAHGSSSSSSSNSSSSSSSSSRRRRQQQEEEEQQEGEGSGQVTDHGVVHGRRALRGVGEQQQEQLLPAMLGRGPPCSEGARVAKQVLGFGTQRCTCRTRTACRRTASTCAATRCSPRRATRTPGRAAAGRAPRHPPPAAGAATASIPSYAVRGYVMCCACSCCGGRRSGRITSRRPTMGKVLRRTPCPGRFEQQPKARAREADGVAVGEQHVRRVDGADGGAGQVDLR